MRRRDFLKAGAWTAAVLAPWAYPLLHLHKRRSSSLGEFDPKNTLEYSKVRKEDKKVLEELLVQLSKDQKPDYTLQDLENNMLLLERGEVAFSATLINNDGYFYTVNHFPYPLVSPSKFHAVTVQGETHNIERLVLAYSIMFYDFVIGKIPAVKNLEIKPLIYHSDVRIGQDVQAVPSPIHPRRKKISGKIIKPHSKYIRYPSNVHTSLNLKSGHSGSLIVTSELKVIGISQSQLGKYFSEGLNVEYMKKLIKCVL